MGSELKARADFREIQGMTTDEYRSAKCGVHLVTFATLPDFPGLTPPNGRRYKAPPPPCALTTTTLRIFQMSSAASQCVERRWQARAATSGGGRTEAPMCAEDVAETGIDGLFDEDGHIMAVC